MMQVSSLKKEKSINQLYLLVVQMRPGQWTKNLLVFAALVFSLKSVTIDMVIKSVYGFILFLLVSSCVYILNDFVDREADRQHPVKRYRPLASGMLNPQLTMVFGGMLLITCLGLSALFSVPFSILLTLYFVVNVLYSTALKQVVILDVMIIASGFVLRAIGGAVLINVKLTPWFLICIMLLSLFLAISKRRHEFILSQESNVVSRKVLHFYNKQLLDQMNSIVTTATLISYALFTFTSGRTIYLMWTIPLVFYGIFRYLYLIHVEGKGGDPDKILFEDKHILGTVLLYAVSVILILRYFE
ncbi:MAG TPA: decaprenyl-phosphate phosphoribosyltransferase [Desulfitobacteriaceae bacterium]|jgi:4-hydroxybenzoate polyprenyltransferase|nr:decaprenyl-phosphate phosphoribosyltransferase [Desulfitobacteriaceae bacterium]